MITINKFVTYHSNQTERKELFELWRLNTLKELGLSKWAE
jgi:hypothetical protein